MTEFTAYATQWAPFNVFQGWVIQTKSVNGVLSQLVQTIRTAPDLDRLKEELGFGQTDKDWQVRADLDGPWVLIWGGLVNAQLRQGEEKTVLPDALLIDPHLGLPVNQYWDAQQYRDAMPELVWKFNPWTGLYRAPEDIANDPQGHLIQQ